MAAEKALLWGDEIPIGKFFERTDIPALHESEPVLANAPLVAQDIRMSKAAAQSFIDELM